MTEGNIQQTISGTEYAAVSATGDVFMYVIHNYREDDRTASIQPADISLEELERPSPYRGLSYFETKHAELFFGRNSQIDELKNATQNRNFIPILGASGSGKSSLVLAGLIPKLAEQGNWLFTYFRLGSNPDPFYVLAEALLPLYRSDDEQTTAIHLAQKLKDNKLEITKIFTSIQNRHPHHKLLLIADQFEQLYTSYNDETQHLFLDLLLSIIQPSNHESLSTVMVTTMRVDFLDKALSYPPFAEALKQGDIKLGSMTRDKLEQVIEQPALKYEVAFQDGLVERILSDVYNKEDCLPLLEFALEELWNKRSKRLKKASLQGEQTDRQLTHKDYTEIGEVKGALATYADDVYNNLTTLQKEQLPKIFIQLINFSQFTKDRTDRRYVRRVAKKTELGEKGWDLVQILAEKRLVVTNRNADDEDTVEIIHETLIKQWLPIETWMNDNRDFGTWLERLRATMSQWEKSDRDSGALLRGKPLNIAEDWLQKRPDDLTNEREYIEKSLALREREEAEKERQELEKLEYKVDLDTKTQRNRILTEANRKAKQIIIFAVLVAAVLGILAKIFFDKQQEAQQGTKLEQAGANALRQQPSGEIDALFSAMHAGQDLKQMIQDNRPLKDYPATSPLLALQKIQDTIHEQNRIDTQQGEIKSVSFSPDGKYIATAGENDTVSLWSASGEKKWQRGDADEVKSMNFVAFSPDGKKIAAAEGDGTITLWDISGKKLKQFTASTTNFKSLSFSPDGKKIATADEEKARLWDLSGKQLAEFVGHKGRVNTISFSPNGQQIATAGYDGTVRLWEVSGKQVKQFTAHKGQEILSVSFSHDRKYLATAAQENIARLWNLSGQELVKLEGHQGSVLNVSFSHDDRMIATTSDDGTVRIWNFLGKTIETLQGHRGAVLSASFAPDGKLVSAGKDELVRLWNLKEKSTQQVELTGLKDDVNAIAFSPNGKTIAGAGDEGIMRLWDSSGKELKVWKEAIQRRPGSQNNVQDIAFSPDGKFIVAGGLNAPIARVWNLEGSVTEPQAKLKGKEKQETHQEQISSVAVSPNSQLIATGSYDKTMRIWKPKSPNGELVAVTPEQENAISRVVFTADGQRIVTADWDGNVAMWDLAGKQISKWKKVHQTQIRGLGITRDGSQIVTADMSGNVKILDSSGKAQPEFFSYQSGTNELAISPDGSLIATGGMDGTVRLWDFQGRQVAEFRNPKGIIWGIAFSPDSQRIALAGEKGFASVRPIDNLPNLMKEGCTWLKDYLAIHPSKKDSLKICQ
jgi:WD40 repeat protein/energy-coupling factor transporter ATP-binding protein EcfA2